MKIFMKIHSFIIALIIAIVLINSLSINTFATSSLNADDRQIINIGVILNNLADPFVVKIKQDLEEIQKENEGKVRITILDGKNNISIQNSILDSVFKNNIDLLMIYLVEAKENVIQDFIYKVKQKNIPTIIIEGPVNIIPEFLKDYKKIVYVNTNSKQAGIAQGKIIVDLWNKDRRSIDKNKDKILQYVLLRGK